MVIPETFSGLGFSDYGFLRSHAERLDPIFKDYGANVLELVDKLGSHERDGLVSGWRQRILLGEVTRREAWFHLLGDRIQWEPWLDALYNSNASFFRKLLEPAKELSWESMLEEIHGKNVGVITGTFRTFPTVAQVAFVSQGFTNGVYPSDVNVLLIEPIDNVLQLKPGKVVFPNELRLRCYSNILGVDIAVLVPRFEGQKLGDFWREKFRQLGGQAKKLVLVISHEEQYPEKVSLARESGFDVKSANYYPHDLPGQNLPLLRRSTSQWDVASSGHDLVIREAVKCILGN